VKLPRRERRDQGTACRRAPQAQARPRRGQQGTACRRALLHPAMPCRKERQAQARSRRERRDRGTACHRALQRLVRLLSKERQARDRPRRGQQHRARPCRKERQAQGATSPRAQWARARRSRRACWDLLHLYRQAVRQSCQLGQLHHLRLAAHGRHPLTRFIHQRIIPRRHLHLIRLLEAVLYAGCSHLSSSSPL
jgi:hypothetical protein